MAMVPGTRYESYYQAPRLSIHQWLYLLRGRFIDLTNCTSTNVSLYYLSSFPAAIPNASSKDYRGQIISQTGSQRFPSANREVIFG